MGTDCGTGAVRPGNPAPLTTFEKVGWTDEAERGLSETFGFDREAIIEGVQAGTLECWRINGGKAWMVTRIEQRELVVCCLQGSGLARLAPVIYRIAQRNGLRAIRFYTRRPGLARMLKRYGFVAAETMYRCEVAP